MILAHMETSAKRPPCYLCHWGVYWRSSRGPVCLRCDEMLRRTDQVVTFGRRGLIVMSRIAAFQCGYLKPNPNYSEELMRDGSAAK